jgi:hypothetical protein
MLIYGKDFGTYMRGKKPKRNKKDKAGNWPAYFFMYNKYAINHIIGENNDWRRAL